jgi:hypothetical protein
VASVPSGPWVNQAFPHGLGPSESVIKFPERQKLHIGNNLRFVEFQLQPMVEVQPQSPAFSFTHQVRHPNPTNAMSTH